MPALLPQPYAYCLATACLCHRMRLSACLFAACGGVPCGRTCNLRYLEGTCGLFCTSCFPAVAAVCLLAPYIQYYLPALSASAGFRLHLSAACIATFSTTVCTWTTEDAAPLPTACRCCLRCACCRWAGEALDGCDATARCLLLGTQRGIASCGRLPTCSRARKDSVRSLRARAAEPLFSHTAAFVYYAAFLSWLSHGTYATPGHASRIGVAACCTRCASPGWTLLVAGAALPSFLRVSRPYLPFSRTLQEIVGGGGGCATGGGADGTCRTALPPRTAAASGVGDGRDRACCRTHAPLLRSAAALPHLPLAFRPACAGGLEREFSFFSWVPVHTCLTSPLTSASLSVVWAWRVAL